MADHDYNMVVLGAGSGGISAVNLAKSLGKKVALVEKNRIGGDCTWYGCVPSKTLIQSCRVGHYIRRAGEFGLRVEGAGNIDVSGVMEHVRAVRDRVYQSERPEVFEKRGIDVVIGEPRFVDAHTIEVGGRTVTSDHFVIATGSSPLVPPIDGIESVPYDTNESLFEREKPPMAMMVLGGGPIGTEMASALACLGGKVSIIQRGGRILERDDEELVRMLMGLMEERGIELLMGCSATGVRQDGDGIVLDVEKANGEPGMLRGDCLLVALGRRPNVDGLDLERAGVEYTKRGIQTDETLRTTAKNIYAIGDVIGSYQFSHIAEYHAGIAVPNALLPLPIKRRIDDENIVWATFTEPEIAHAGLTEAEAREKHGDDIRVYRYPYEKIDRAITDLATDGLAKFVCDRKGMLLGIHILGERASDLLHEAQLAKTLGVPFEKIAEMIHIYPTYGDLVKRPATAAYADSLQANPFVRMAKKLSGGE